MNSQTLPPPQGPEYTPCGCRHIEPEHRPNAGPCLVCDCGAYRPASEAAVERIARHLAARERLGDEARWGETSLEFRDLYRGAAREVIALVREPAGGDRGALRDGIADAIRDAACSGDCGKTEEECAKERIQPFAWHHGRLAVVEGEPEQFADAVLAVLPEPADRAAAERLARVHEWVTSDVVTSRSEFGNGYREAQRDIRDLLDGRRMADETATTETQPRRGDRFEAWLKTQRDRYDRHGDSSEFWHEFDRVLDEYRLHADMGVPLDGHVCEARVVGDCECLEQPTAAARQDGAQSSPPPA